ncbi:MAG: hypothetical protein IPI67_05185 [Myxococcales bacterium]|nr:hypothetical protein [Myxococcales bacterium]
MNRSFIPRIGGLALGLTAACAAERGPAHRAPVGPRLEIPAAASAGPPAPAAPAPSQALPEVLEPAATACRFNAKSWGFESLRLADGETGFATAYAAPVEIFVPPGAPHTSVAVIDDGEVVLKGVVPAGELLLYAKKATALGGFLVPKFHVPLRWMGGAAGKLRVGVDAKSRLASPEVVEDDIACAELDLLAASFSARELITKRAHLPEKLVLRQGAALTTAIGETPPASLLSGLRAEVLETQRGSSRILIDAASFILFGWVDSADLGPAPPVNQFGRLGGRHRTRLPMISGGQTCARDLSLIAEVGEVRSRVGSLRAGTRFQPLFAPPEPMDETGAPPPRRSQRRARVVAVQLPRTRWLRLAEGARLSVLEDELRECERAPDPH